MPFNPTNQLCLIVEVLASRRKLPQSSGYSALINDAFTFRTSNVFGYFLGLVRIRKAYKFPIQTMLYVHLNYFQITHVSEHSLPLYYQPWRVPSNTAGTVSVMWYRRRKPKRTRKITAKRLSDPSIYSKCKIYMNFVNGKIDATHSYLAQIGWGCRIHRLYFCRGG